MVYNCRKYTNLTTEEVVKELNKRKLFIPIGSVEQHGPHLPLCVDTDISTAVAGKLAEMEDGLLAPAVEYASRSIPHCGGGHTFPGTVFAKGEVLIQYLKDILANYCRYGAKYIVVVNGHYENEPFIFEAIEQVRMEGLMNDTKVIALSWWSIISDAFIHELFGNNFPGWHAEHASLTETALMMYIQPEKVRKEGHPNNETPPLAGIYIHPIDSTVISDRGSLAKTIGASPETGEKLFAEICQNMKALIKNPHGMKK